MVVWVGTASSYKVADSDAEGDTYNLIFTEVIPALENQRGGS